MGSLLNMSGAGLLNKVLPYDAKVEYLESSGGNWFLLDIYQSDSVGISAEVEFADLGNTHYERQIFGSKSGGIRYYALCAYGGHWCYGWNDFYVVDNAVVRNTKYTIDFNYLNNRQASVNNTVISTLNQKLPPGSDLQKMTLLTGNYNSIESITLIGKIYKATITDGSTIIYDLIPVRVGNVGYMYDKVSKQLFGNSGTGSFILGPDKH